MKLKSKKTACGLLILLLIFIAVRLALPVFIKKYVVDLLNETPGYQGQVEEVSLSVLEGSLSFKNISLRATDAAVTPPLMDIPALKIGLDWRALLTRHIYTYGVLNRPSLVIMTKPSAKNHVAATTPDEIWSNLREVLYRLKLQTLTVKEGTISYQNYTDSPAFKIDLNDVEIEAENLQVHASKANPLPAQLSVNALAFGQAKMNLNLDCNPYAVSPAFKLQSKLESLQLKNIDSVLQHYTDLKFKSGTLSIYLEAAVQNNHLTGYIKPLVQNLKFELPLHAKGNPVKRVYHAMMQGLANLLKNKGTQKNASKISISGPIEDPALSIWSLVTSLLENAFVKALVAGFNP